MVQPEDSTQHSKSERDHLVKKCPNCYTYLPLRAKVCTSCNARVGDVDKLGFAQRPINWWGYLTAAVSIVALVIFVWWAFFRE